MFKFLKYLFWIVAVVLVLFYLRVNFFSPDNGDDAPDFKATLIDGSDFKLSDLQGKYVVLDFWGSWCPPCIKEAPQLVDLHNKYGKEIYIVTIGLEKNDKTWKKFADRFGYSWKYQIVDQNQFVMMSSIARKYGVTEIPAKFLISPEGKLLGEYSFKQIDSTLFSNGLMKK